MSVHQVLQQQELHRGSELDTTVHHMSEMFRQQQELDAQRQQDGVRCRRCDLPELVRAEAEVLQAGKVNRDASSRSMYR